MVAGHCFEEHSCEICHMKFILSLSIILFLMGGIDHSKVLQASPNVMKETDDTDSLALRYLVHEPEIKSKQKKALIFLHGHGSNEDDLFSFAQVLPKDIYLICPRGPVTIAEGSYAWYQVNFATGKPSFDPQEEMKNREALRKFVKEIRSKYDLDEVYLGGFSQGAIMSCSVGLIYPKEVKGIVCLSGRILQEIRAEVKPGKPLSKLKVFVAHGTQDGMLPVSYAREAKTYLDSLHVQVSYHEFRMTHQINHEVLRELNAWLKQ
jgi:phospholipase/carboxylesterase